MVRNIYVGDNYSRKVVTPLITTDLNSYRIIWDTKCKSGVFKITAVKSDNSSVFDFGELSDEGVATYVIANNMYDTEGPLKLFLAIVEDESVTTCREISFTVREGANEATFAENNANPINSLTMQVVANSNENTTKLQKLKDYGETDVYILKEGEDITVSENVVTQLLNHDFSNYDAIAFPEGITEINLPDTNGGGDTPLIANKVIMPKSLKAIGRCSFSNLAQLDDKNNFIDSSIVVDVKEYVLNEGLETIGDYAFANNIYLEKVNIPESIKEINIGAFQYCDSLKEIFIPATVTKIGDGNFTTTLFNQENATVVYSYAGSEAERYARKHNLLKEYKNNFVNVGSNYSSEGENSAIFGSSSNKLEEQKLPTDLYYKPIAEEYYDGTENNPRYKFENLTFTTNATDTLLEKLYTYTDKWGNKCYTVYEDYSPDNAKDTVEEVSADDPMLKSLKYEALFNKGTYFAVADGENSFSSGKDNIASGDDTFSVGYRNIVLADSSTALGRYILVRGVGANGFGLNGKATGRYAIVFNEGGQALGYASLAFGDHCKALNYYDVAGGFQSVAKGNTSFAFGRNVIASGFGAIALGQLTVADGRFCIVGGNANECYGDCSLIAGIENIVKGSRSIVGGERNTVDGVASIVGGIGNTNTGNWGLLSGTQNNLGGNNSAVIGVGNINNGRNGSLVAGQKNTNEGERSSIVGGINNYIAAAATDSLAVGGNIKIAKEKSVAIGTTIESENTQCWSIGRRLKTARDRQMILGIGNEEDPDAMLIIGAGHNNDTDANAKRINALTVRQYTGNVEIPRPVLISSSGNKFLLKVSDDGTLSTERV